MIDIDIYQRLSHRYVDECRDLDTHVFLGWMRFTPAVMTREPEDFDEGGEWKQYTRLPAGLNRGQRDLWVKAITSSLSHHGCTHEYDCCGCQSVSARVFRVPGSARDLLVTKSVRYNY